MMYVSYLQMVQKKKPIKYTHINMDRKYKENTEEKHEFIS